MLSAAVIAASAPLGLHTDPELIAELEGEVFFPQITERGRERERERDLSTLPCSLKRKSNKELRLRFVCDREIMIYILWERRTSS